MVVENTEVNTAEETTTEPTTEASSEATETVETSDEPVTTDEGDEAAEPTEPAPYVPNTKFNVRNEEHQFDEWVVPLITDEETEKKVRELFEKSKGIDHVKRDRQSLKETTSHLKKEIEETYKPVLQQNQALNHFLQQGDLGSFFHYSGLKPQDVLKWSVDYAQLPPDQRVGMERTAMNNVDSVNQNFQTADANQKMMQELGEYRHKEIDWICQSNQNVSGIQQAFDQQNGMGAFKQEVINRGIMYAKTQNRDVPPDQVVQEVCNLLGGGMQTQQTQQINQQQVVQPQQPQNMNYQQSQQMPTQPAAPKPVIPNIQGRGTSPAKKKVKSLADLRELANKLD